MEQDVAGLDAERSVEDVHGVRLMALLQQLVRERDLKGAAEELGVDARTLATSLRRGRLSGHTRVALDRLLLADSVAAVERLGDQVQALAQRVDALEERVGAFEASPDVLERTGAAVDSAVAALREEHAGAVRGLGRRLGRVEAALQGGSGTAPQGAEGDRPRRPVYRRAHPKVVTAEPEFGEEDVYGEAGPLVVEWRRARDAWTSVRGGLARAAAEERMRELEVALIGEHGLTLPPNVDPWDSLTMKNRLWGRRTELDRVRRERARAQRRRWLRRVLTLGLWWE